MKTYEGICRGGPYDGCLLSFTAPLKTVPLIQPLKVLDQRLANATNAKTGTYRYVLGQWIWRMDRD